MQVGETMEENIIVIAHKDSALKALHQYSNGTEYVKTEKDFLSGWVACEHYIHNKLKINTIIQDECVLFKKETCDSVKEVPNSITEDITPLGTEKMDTVKLSLEIPKHLVDIFTKKLEEIDI